MINYNNPRVMVENKDGWVSIPNYNKTGVIPVLKAQEDDNVEIGSNWEVGQLSLGTNPGVVRLTNMDIDDSIVLSGVEMSTIFSINDDNLLKLYSETDGLGDIQNQRLETEYDMYVTSSDKGLVLSDGTNSWRVTVNVSGDLETTQL